MNADVTGSRRRLRRVLAALCAVVVVLGVAACGSSSSDSGGGGGNDTWTHGILKPKGDSGYQLMAKARDYYKKQGVDVEIKEFVGNVQLVQALVSGAIDSGDTAPGPIYDAFQKGADVRIIGSTLPKVTYTVIANKSIKSFKDLEGKTIGASAPGAYPDAVVKAMLAKQGLDPNGVKVVSVGSDAQRFQALEAGRIDAAAVSVQFVPTATKSDKIHVLGQAQEIIPEYPRFFLMANGKALKDKPEAAVKFLAGEMQGLCYAVQHPDAELKVTADALNVSPDDPQLVYAQKVIAKAHAASPTAAIPMSRLEFLQKFRIAQGFQKGKIDLSKLVDPTIREKALKLADLPQQCLNDPRAKE